MDSCGTYLQWNDMRLNTDYALEVETKGKV
jgi:hypothetical protein